MLESVEKLRNKLKREFSVLSVKDLEHHLDLIDAEIAERYMALPVDADGVPIHMGDIVEGELLRDLTVEGTACAFYLYDDEPDSVCIKINTHGGWTIRELRIANCRHVKPRTVEDVLREYGDAVDRLGQANVDMSTYADELREMLGGDAE